MLFYVGSSEVEGHHVDNHDISYRKFFAKVNNLFFASRYQQHIRGRCSERLNTMILGGIYSEANLIFAQR